MNILRSLTTRNLKLNRKRTIVSIIGIILSTAMICGVATLIASFQDLFIQSAHQTDGRHHATFYEVPVENSPYITEHLYTYTAMYSRDLGFVHLEGNKNENKPYLLIKEYDQEAFAHLPISLLEGSFPQESGEIVLSEEVIRSGGLDINVGDRIIYEIGQRIDHGVVVTGELVSETERIEPHTKETYTVTGILKSPRFESHHLPAFIGIAYLEPNSLSAAEKVNISIVVKKPKQIFEQVPAMAEAAGISNVAYNQELLKWLGVTRNEIATQMIQNVGFIIILLIVVGSVTVIYNAFAISVNERKKQFGMLASVGATSKQIKKMVFLEGVILGLIAIPIGILSGILGIGITLKIVNHLMVASMFTEDIALRLIVSPYTLSVTIIFVALTIWLSVFIPARRAAKTSPVEAIRLNTDIKIKSKQLKTSRLTRIFFGMEGELALKNLKRNRGRYRATLFSLFISIVLYVSFSSFMTYGFVSSDMLHNEMSYEMAVEVQNISVEEQLSFFQEVAKLEKVEEYSIVRSIFVLSPEVDRSKFGRFLQENYIDEEEEPGRDNYFRNEEGGYELAFNIVSVGEEQFNKYMEQLNLDKTAFQDPYQQRGIILNKSKIEYPMMVEFEPVNYNQGEHILLQNFQYEEEEPFFATIEIGAITDQYPFGVPYTGLYSVTMIVSNQVFEVLLEQFDDSTKHQAEYARLYMNAREGTHAVLEEEIRELEQLFDHPSYSLQLWNNLAMIEEMKRTKTVISIFLYGFVSLITLIGVTNIFNTISTNVALRRREFAMLKSIGLTSKGFNKMIHYESIFYGLKALIYGLPVGMLISYWMYRSVQHMFVFSFILPWKEIIVCVAGVFIIVFITMMHASSKLKKENIIDALKEENI